MRIYLVQKRIVFFFFGSGEGGFPVEIEPQSRSIWLKLVKMGRWFFVGDKISSQGYDGSKLLLLLFLTDFYPHLTPEMGQGRSGEDVESHLPSKMMVS